MIGPGRHFVNMLNWFGMQKNGEIPYRRIYFWLYLARWMDDERWIRDGQRCAAHLIKTQTGEKHRHGCNTLSRAVFRIVPSFSIDVYFQAESSSNASSDTDRRPVWNNYSGGWQYSARCYSHSFWPRRSSSSNFVAEWILSILVSPSGRFYDEMRIGRV